MNMEKIIPVFLVILGWVIVHCLTIEREKKREWREIAKKTVIDIEALERLAIQYHTNIIRNTDVEQAILKEIERLNDKLWNIRQKLSIPTNIRELRKAITLDNFGTPHIIPQEKNSPIIRKIEVCSAKLIRELYLAE